MRTILPVLLHRSVKARLTVLVLALALTCSIALVLYVQHLMHTDVEEVLTAQQMEASTALATSIDQQLRQRQAALEQVATLAGSRAQDPRALRALLNELPVFQNQFNGGAFITDDQGLAVASFPASVTREGSRFADLDYIAQTLRDGAQLISSPHRDRVLGSPSVVMTSPIRRPDGRVVGVLAGVIDLGQPGFLQASQFTRSNAASTTILVSPRDRQVITATDPGRMLAPLPPRGESPVLDRFIDGFEGTATFVDPRGIEVVAFVKRIPVSGWYIAVSLPTEDAFAQAHAIVYRMLLAGALLALGSAACIGWVVHRQLAPLAQAASTLGGWTSQQLATGNVPELPVAQKDEIGILIQSFNRMVSELSRQRRDLARSELLYSTAFRTSPDAISITRLDDGRFIVFNDSFTRLFGWGSGEITDVSSSSIGLWRRPGDRTLLVETLRKHGRCEGLEAEFVSRDGRIVTVQMSAALIELDAQPCILAVTHDITARKQSQAQIEQLSFNDVLTGLPNRRLLLDRLQQVMADSLRHARRAALLYIDLDDFKSLNDRIGHEQGDQVLRLVAERLSAAVRPGDTVARLGNDEFVVLLKELAPDPAPAQSQAQALGETLLARLRETMSLDGADCHGRASMGLVMLNGDGASASMLLSQGDLAMHHAKSAGGDRLCVFDASMQDGLNARVAMEDDLRSALRDGQFRLHYQAQVDQSGRLVGAEALVRWQHPLRGIVSPGEFIPVAEDSGLIVELGSWILGQACEQLAQWQGDPLMAGIKVSVNVSSRQFEQADFVALVLGHVAASGIEPSQLQLELTESLLIDNIEDITHKMTALRREGIRFALDDFGTGFSSLSYLKRLPFDELKIDQGFVRNIESEPNDLAIARMVVALGRSLGLVVLAEGVETTAQRDVLVGLGCECFQGYLFSRSLEAGEFAAFARRQSGAAAA